MSRNFEVQVEIFPYNDARIADVLVDWGLAVDSDCQSFDHEDVDGWSFWGAIQLMDGTTEKQMHEQLRTLLPDRVLTTRWRWIDDQQWDDVIQTEPLKPARK